MLEKIKSFLFGVFGIVFFAFALTMTILLLNYNDYGVTQFGDTTFIIINDDITSDLYKKGDLVLVDNKKIDEIVVGDQVFVYHLDGKGGVDIELGKVGQVYPEEDAIAFENGATYAMQFVAGTGEKIYNDIGFYLSIIESRWGFLFLVLVPCFLFFIYEIYALIVEIKHGAEED